ncbi:MAG TPA: peptide chain release factor 1 [Elusimicrobia bacterium]|nr:MAG: peptide chain release factor 1 [Elusimicrobia bacterium RIFOXYA12_FULL_49_49]OGS10706.1 MAG: peptide chain release factor 1 [Elusimicrobia bacterium RIFOXYB1_FULL_48_9]OGS16854.1 MAG: peptide chain release factor 1 [Elusimicrobia bacterium RIFOXYA2_FULL_47_53]OGS32082.1 MAG: peptide chain release factor 1 [Elusimicrobia bacterium RIFOXYB2_FULL_46_23]HBU69975.1 peptide chain release factor 1 [Elusimicrobiota bacterium]
MIENKLENIEKRFLEVEKQLSDHGITSRVDDYKNLSKEHSALQPLIHKYRDYKRLLDEIKGLESLKESSDLEMKLMAQSELEELSRKKALMTDELKVLLLPKDPNEEKNIIIEIRAGTGGEEAALFAGDLFRMYCRYADTRRWKVDIMDSNPTGLGGFKEVVFGLSGEKVWKFLKYERGVHRVQRVPETEASGRIHTSAISVAVLPEAEEVEVGIKPDEIRIDTYRASGAGGQHVNKTESAIRITHIPTGLVVACQDERSQMKNRAKAMKLMLAKLYESRQKAQEDAIISERRNQIGSGDRSEKIRTYNFPQNRITDHRINYTTHRLKEVLEGDLDEMINALIAADQAAQLTDIKE